MDASGEFVALAAGYGIGAGLAAGVRVATQRGWSRWVVTAVVGLSVLGFRLAILRWAPGGIGAMAFGSGSIGWVLFAVGLAASLPLLPLATSAWGGVVRDVLGVASLFAVLSCGALLTFKEKVGFSSAERDVRPPGRFRVRMMAELPYLPLRVAVEGDQAFVSYEDVGGGRLNGGIYSVRPKGDGFESKSVVSSPFLFRPHGLAVRGGQLFVSRSGLSPHAVDGRVYYDGVGAVTRLEDKDGDGKFEYWHDVIQGLTGVRGPDTLHQSNGLAVAADGTIYVANSHDHNRSLDPHPLAGAVVRLAPGTDQVEIFAQGFRNPWSLTIAPDGQLFLTDNDIEENPGDEVNLVLRGRHYGHPFAVPGEGAAAGFEPPLAHEPNRVLTGLAFVPKGAWPAPFDDSLYVNDLVSGEILRFGLKADPATGGVSIASKQLFARAPSPIDLAFVSGKLYVLSRYHKRLYLVEPK